MRGEMDGTVSEDGKSGAVEDVGVSYSRALE